MKFQNIIWLLNGNFELIDNETDCCGATLVLEKTAKFVKNGKVEYDSDFYLTSYGKNKFDTILNSRVVAINDNGYIMLDCEWKYIEEFLNACNGNIAEKEYNLLFNKESELSE